MTENTEQATGVLEGEILAGKYRVERVLGVGGMGAVIAAWHIQLDTRVAIKFLLPSMLGHEEAVARFAREARSAIRMNSEHVARIFDVGTLATGAPYMVMEFLDGVDLAALLGEKGPLSIEQAVDFLLQASEAVAEAHALGIVHRDLKPGNLFCVVRPDGRRIIKVLDFGISKVTPAAPASVEEMLTQAAAVMGTPPYMSPEQLETPDTVDSRTDIWALGVILYELLTGQMPFMGNTLPQVSVKIAVRAPPPLRDLRPEAPSALAQVIDTCLEKDREKRYANVAELASALLPFGSERARASVDRITETVQAAGLMRADVVPPSLEPSSQSLPTEADTPTELAANGGRSRTWALIALAALAVLGIAFFGVDAKHWATRDTQPPKAVRPAARKLDPQSAFAAPLDASLHATSTTAPLPVVSASAVVSALPVASALSVGSALPVVPAATLRPYSPALLAPPLVKPLSVSRPLMTAAVTRAPSKVSCTPNFELDDQGRKHFKPECVNGQAAASATPNVATRSDCDPNFELDDQGRKHFKPECFSRSDPR